MRRGLRRGVLGFRGAPLVGCALAAVTLWVVPSSAAGAGLVAEDHAFPAPAVDSTATDAALAPNGIAAAAWVEILSGGQSRVDVSVRLPGGDWSAPQPLGGT